MSERLCIFCVHGGFTEAGGGDYPDPSTFDCALGLLPVVDGHWDGGRSRIVYSIEGWREIIVAAKDCPSYEQVKV